MTSSMPNDAPDFARLRVVAMEMERLHDAKKLTLELFRDLAIKARAAVNGHTEFLEFLTLYAQPGWLK